MDRNIFGLHLTQPPDLEKGISFINGKQGGWGFATITIRKDQMDQKTWQDFFNQCRKLHVQPIIRIATTYENGSWKRPEKSYLNQVSAFLNSLNWPTSTLPIILFNEPNQAKEWGGQVDVKDYVDTFIFAASALKSHNPNFIILGPSLDLDAPNYQNTFKAASNFYKEIYSYKPEYFQHLDALASHSYPNPHFSGSPKDSGKSSIQGYIWELDFIKNLGINKNFNVYITETGWQISKKINRQKAAAYLQKAYEKWQSDPRVIAVTPFIFNYPYPPFKGFSWVDVKENVYPEFKALANLPQAKNQPNQTDSFQVLGVKLPVFILPNIVQIGEITLKNTGQTIWGESTYCFNSLTPDLTPLCLEPKLTIEPEKSHTFSFNFQVKDGQNQPTLTWERGVTIPLHPVLSVPQIYSSHQYSFLEKLLQKLKDYLQW